MLKQLQKLGIRPQSSRSSIDRLFTESFTAEDIAGALISFDAQTPMKDASIALKDHGGFLVGVREQGLISGYIPASEMKGKGSCGQNMRPIPKALLVRPDTPIQKIIPRLMDEDVPGIFVTQWEQPVGIIFIGDLQRPAVRMWLFGVISVIEMAMAMILERFYSNDTWISHLSSARVDKAREMQILRVKAGDDADLLDCLQFGDKIQLVSRSAELRRLFGQKSRREAGQQLRKLERLRNTLAHGQVLPPAQCEVVVQLVDSLQEAPTQLVEELAAMLQSDKN